MSSYIVLYLEAIVRIFSACSENIILKSEKLLREKEKEGSSGGDTKKLDLEEEF